MNNQSSVWGQRRWSVISHLAISSLHSHTLKITVFISQNLCEALATRHWSDHFLCWLHFWDIPIIVIDHIGDCVKYDRVNVVHLKTLMRLSDTKWFAPRWVQSKKVAFFLVSSGTLSCVVTSFLYYMYSSWAVNAIAITVAFSNNTLQKEQHLPPHLLLVGDVTASELISQHIYCDCSLRKSSTYT